MKVEVLRSTVDHLTDQAISTGAASLVPSGAVVVLVRGMMLARAFPVCELALPMAINQDLKALLPCPGINGSFLAWSLRGTESETLNRLDEAGHGTKALRMEAWQSMLVAVPSEAEQVEIAEALLQITSRLDDLGREAQQAITLLQERRAALIAAAVTGRIDVRQRSEACSAVDQATARRLVGAALLELVADNPASGRMTSAKRLYLAETHAGLWELRGQPERMAAGPFDRELMREVEAELGRVGHIATSQPGGPKSQVLYTMTGTRGALRADLDAMLGDRRVRFDKMLADLGKLESKGVEGVATLFAVWNDMVIDGQTPTDDAVINGVLNDWNAEKRDKFTRPDLVNYLGWMRRHDLTPSGRGPRTKMGSLI